MRKFRAILGVFVLILLGAAFATSSGANQIGSATRTTIVTINHPMEIPGGTILQPGKYVFQLVTSAALRNVLRISKEDGTHIAFIMGIPDYRLKPTDEAIVEYKEEAAGKPIALRGWFYSGVVNGLEFVYPKKRAVELAEESHEFVPADAAALPSENNEASAESLKNELLVAITPEGKEEPVSEAFEQKVETPTEVAQTLPKTASPVPLIALLGGTFLAVGLGLKRFAKHGS